MWSEFAKFLHVKLSKFRAAKLKGFTVLAMDLSQKYFCYDYGDINDCVTGGFYSIVK